MTVQPISSRVIYLDFDGVLHPAGIRRHYQTGIVSNDDGGELFRWMPILEKLIADQEVSIVLSTSWVTAFDYEQALARLSPPIAQKVIGATWELGKNTISKSFFVRQFRHEQIVADAAHRGLDEARWLAIDDETETTPFHLRDQFAPCDPWKGISDPAIQAQISSWLKR